MATLVRIDDIYLNLDNVTRITVDDVNESVIVSFSGAVAMSEYGPSIVTDQIVLQGEQGARLLQWLDAGRRSGTVPPLSHDDSLEARCTIVAHEEDGEPIFASERADGNA